MRTNKIYKIIILSVLAIVTLARLAILRPQKKFPKYNIILITLDACRADHLGCYGYRRNTSPNIDALAGKGCLFTQAISQSSWTSASVSSILTSLYPDHALIEIEYSLSPENPNLIKILKDNGYVTALFSGNTLTSTTLSNIKDAFDIFYVKDEKADEIVRKANNWLTNNIQFPFFLWIYILEPHAPYAPPFSYYSAFLSDNVYPRKNVPIAEDDGVKNKYYSFGVIPRYVAEKGIVDTSYYISKYDGGIKFADEQIGKLLNQLNKLKLENNTLIILFSDHGESMTEHNFYFNHSHFLYDELIRIPLIIVLPKKIPKGKFIQEQVQLIDIMPTVFDLMKIKSDIIMEGDSLIPLIRGKKRNPSTYAFSESSFSPAPQCIRTLDWKLIYNRKKDKYELYNLRRDPKELNNLISVEKEKFEFLRQKLDEHIKQAKCHKITKSFLSEETKERLKSLGYVQ